MHQAAAFRVAYVLTASTAEAEDAAQEAFVKAYLALDRFRAGAPFRPWLLTIVGNEARNRLRARGRREGLADRALAAIRGGATRATTDGSPRPAAAAASPELEVLVGETQAEVRAALRTWATTSGGSSPAAISSACPSPRRAPRSGSRPAPPSRGSIAGCAGCASRSKRRA